MSNKMLIDATHPEETRVVVVRDKRVEDFDFETASKRPLRGNIYLAKVTRVEPSLQAAFIEYGGNRHGFLAFSEIHPDYYQIPQADRAALLAEERAVADDEDDAERGKSRRRRRGGNGRGERREATGNGAAAVSEGTTEDVVTAEATLGTTEDVADGAQDSAEEVVASADADEVAPDAAADGMPDDTSTDLASADGDAPQDVEETHSDDSPGTSEVLESMAGDEAPAAIDRAVEQVIETIDADADAASEGPVHDAELANDPTRPAEPGEGVELSEATVEAAAGGVGTAEVPAPVEPEAEAPAPKPRRKRATTPRTTKPRTPKAATKKTAEGLADPEVSDDDADEANGDDEASTITSVGGQDAMEEIPERRRTPPRRNYKIQEVIKRRQILLVQVVKEERGTKGAALTTYLSLAGRYSVLMPNTDRGGGVSRKITDNADRRRLKELMEDLEVPEGMGIILRTAGAARTKTEIKRDFEYLMRLWESVRELTLKSIAPKLVYEEGNLVKRAIRDLYSKEIDEILVAGEPACREAQDFMHMLMPSHAKNVKLHREPTPIFTQYGIEPQLDAMFSPHVTLPSKGYIVINPTEALVSIDVNSGRSTKESNIEETAYKTNLEAADEVARQLRLRDLAGLIVIDFIDMDDKRHNRAVEKRLKDALKLDRSRIQVGHISPFGLLEMSRQRIRQGMVETSMVTCPSCGGTGHVRSTQSVALHCLRALEEHLLKHGDHHVTLRTTTAVALYILNQKRSHLNALEERFELTIGVEADETIVGQHLSVVPGARAERMAGEAPPVVAMVSPLSSTVEDDEAVDELDEAGSEAEAEAVDEAARAEAQGGEAATERSGRRRRRRRRRGGNGEAEREASPASERAELDAGAAGEDFADEDESDDDADSDASEETGGEVVASDEADGEDSETERRSRRRRGRRGGRRHRRDDEMLASEEGRDGEAEGDRNSDDKDRSNEATETEVAAELGDADSAAGADAEVAPTSVDAAAPDAAASPRASNGAEREPETTSDELTESEAGIGTAAEQHAEEAEPAPEQKSEPRARRVGWWQRRSFF